MEINNIRDLKARIAFLEIKKAEDEIYFNQKYTSVKNAIEKPFKFIKGAISSLAFGSKSDSVGRKADWATSLGRIILPLFINKTLLRSKGIVIKTLVSLFSQKAVNYSVFNKDILSNWIDKVTHLVKSKPPKEKRYGLDDYGIPPESETA